MLYQNNGDRFAAEGKLFEVGGQVFANENSPYMGLFGVVKEIRFEDDRDAEYDPPAIRCDFDPPDASGQAYTREQPVPGPFGCPKAVDALNLAGVTMTPEMLEPIPRTLPERAGFVYALFYYADSDSSSSFGTLAVSPDAGILLRRMMEDLKKQGTEVVLSHVISTGEGFSFTYEAKETGVEDLYLNYSIVIVDVLPAMEGGAAA